MRLTTRCLRPCRAPIILCSPPITLLTTTVGSCSPRNLLFTAWCVPRAPPLLLLHPWRAVTNPLSTLCTRLTCWCILVGLGLSLFGLVLLVLLSLLLLVVLLVLLLLVSLVVVVVVLLVLTRLMKLIRNLSTCPPLLRRSLHLLSRTRTDTGNPVSVLRIRERFLLTCPVTETLFLWASSLMAFTLCTHTCMGLAAWLALLIDISIVMVLLAVALLLAVEVRPLDTSSALVLGVLLRILTFTLPTTETTLLSRLGLMTLLGRRLPILVQARQFRLPFPATSRPTLDRRPWALVTGVALVMLT